MSSTDTHAHRSGGNSSGLLRDFFFTKGSDFRKITPARLDQVETMLNNHPHNCLNYRTPAEILNA